MAYASRAHLPTESPDRVLARIASAQYGAFSREQARSAGLDRGMLNRRVAAGGLRVLSKDVFAVAGAPDSWRLRLMAVVLAWGPDAVVSHRAAAALWRLAGFFDGLLEITVKRDVRRDAPGTVRRNALATDEVRTHDGFRVTSPARTLIDLAGIVSDPQQLEIAFDDALRRGLVTISSMRREAARHSRKGRAGIIALRALIESRAGKPHLESAMETKLLALIMKARVGTPVRQYAIGNDRRLIAVLDFAFPDAHIGLEADGFDPHGVKRRWSADKARDNELMLMGWSILRFTWDQITNQPNQVIATIRRALAPSL